MYVSLNCFMLRNSRHNSIPLGCGIMRSRIMRSGEKDLAVAMVFLLFSSVLILNPSFSRLYLRRSRISLSSSTTSTRKDFLSILVTLHQNTTQKLPEVYTSVMIQLIVTCGRSSVPASPLPQQHFHTEQ